MSPTRIPYNICGTIGGWWRHHRAGEQACAPCEAAKREYASQRHANVRDQAIADLMNIDGSDPEKAHDAADQVLYAVAPKKIREAYDQVKARTKGWWSA